MCSEAKDHDVVAADERRALCLAAEQRLQHLLPLNHQKASLLLSLWGVDIRAKSPF